jgi:hypothetical protein
MICELCFAIVPDGTTELYPGVSAFLALEKGLVCTQCIVLNQKKPWIFCEDWAQTCRAIGCNHLTSDDINVLYESC